MFKGVGKEWSPTLGVSWQVPQVPVSDGIPPETSPPSETSSLIPATPVMVMGLVLKMACPLATDARKSCEGSVDQAS